MCSLWVVFRVLLTQFQSRSHHPYQSDRDSYLRSGVLRYRILIHQLLQQDRSPKFPFRSSSINSRHRRTQLTSPPSCCSQPLFFKTPNPQLFPAHTNIGRLVNDYQNSSKVLSFSDAWGAYTIDNITQYTVGWVYDFLDYPHFQAPFLASSRALAKLAHVTPQFPWLSALLQSLPEQVLGFLQPSTMPIIEIRRVSLHDLLWRFIHKGRNQRYSFVRRRSERSVFSSSTAKRQPKV